MKTTLTHDPSPGTARLPDPEKAEFIRYWQNELEQFGTEQILRWALETYHPRLAMAATREPGDYVLAAMLEQLKVSVETVNLCLFPEKADRQNRPIERSDRVARPLFSSHCVHRSEKANGETSHRFYTERFARSRWSLPGDVSQKYDAVLIGTRRDQKEGYANMPVFQWDGRFGIVKIAPLARWTEWSIRDKIARDSISLQAPVHQKIAACRFPSTYTVFPEEDDPTEFFFRSCRYPR